MRCRRSRSVVLCSIGLTIAACGETQDDLTASPDPPESPPVPHGESLFRLVPHPDSATLSQYQTRLTAIQEQKTTLDVRFGVLTEHAKTLLESGKPLSIRVAPDMEFTAVREDFGRRTTIPSIGAAGWPEKKGG